jgi:hypothetical protein
MDSVVELFYDVHVLGMPSVLGIPSLPKPYKKPTATYLFFFSVLAPKSTSNCLIGVLSPMDDIVGEPSIRWQVLGKYEQMQKAWRGPASKRGQDFTQYSAKPPGHYIEECANPQGFHLLKRALL